MERFICFAKILLREHNQYTNIRKNYIFICENWRGFSNFGAIKRT